MPRLTASAPLGAITALALARTACVAPADLPDATRLAVLADVGPRVVLPALRRFEERASALASAADGGDLDATRAAYAAAARAWQEVEVLQIGPLASSLASLAGEDLRDGVYSWPTVNACRVDQETVEQGYAAADFFVVNDVNVWGLDALEALLFRDPAREDCPSQVGIDDAWAALGDAEVQARRAAYARVVAEDLAARATDLVTRWDPAGGDWGATLAAAGTDGSPWASVDDALDEVFAAALYVETRVKSVKLATPLGLPDGLPDPAATEARWSGESAAWIRSNLVGFRALFDGGDGVGFDDLLAASGGAELAARIQAASDDALAACDALPGGLEAALVDDPDAAQALYAAVDALSDLLRDELTLAVSLRLPAEAAGDND